MKVDKKNLEKFKSQLKKLSKVRIQIGAVGNHEGGISNAALLEIHEFGATVKNGFGKGIKIVIPARAPIRNTIRDEDKMRELRNNIQKLIEVNKSDKGYNIEAIANGIGNNFKDLIVETIMQRLPIPLNPSTLKLRSKKGIGGDIPLYATGQFLNSIEYGVIL